MIDHKIFAAQHLAHALEKVALYSKSLPLEDQIVQVEILERHAERLRAKYPLEPLSDFMKGYLLIQAQNDFEELKPRDRIEELTGSWIEADWYQYLEEYEVALDESDELRERVSEVNVHRDGHGQPPFVYTTLEALMLAERQMEDDLLEKELTNA